MTTASNDEYATTPINDSTPQSDKTIESSTPDTRHPIPDTPRKPLRLWPGVAAAVLLALAWFVIPFFKRDAMLYGMLGGFIGIVAILLWWVFFSRARWFERLGALVLIVGALFVTSRLIHVSIRTGAMGFLFPVLAVPVVSLAFVAWAVATRRLSDKLRRLTLVATIILACGVFTLIRTGGFTGDFEHDLHWRWSKTPEERLLAQGSDQPSVITTASAAVKTGAEWPGFRGPQRDGVVRGTRIKTDWKASPPVELWRRPIGPGWSSFAVSGDLIYTQEQRGGDEIVACYDINTGKPIWRHRDTARFWESNAGAGPRATPTFNKGRLYTLGATGIVNALDADTGAVMWTRNSNSDTGSKTPGWGFSGSPLVVGDRVIVATAGKLVAYDFATGKPLWFGPNGGDGYSSPQLLTIDGVPQIVLLSEAGATSVAVADGTKLWEHQWPGVPITQPALGANGDILISVSESSGTRSLAVKHEPNGWTVNERWTSEALNPYFNDFVVHNGHAFGFDWNTLTCIDLKDGNRKWKGGKYGHGQLVLLPDQNVLLILSEAGELALVQASTDQFTELARFPAIKGKTWNHPVLVRDVVLVRNGEEMAAFRLSLSDS
jgi:outer membrane protein assembly factor BamB